MNYSKINVGTLLLDFQLYSRTDAMGLTHIAKINLVNNIISSAVGFLRLLFLSGSYLLPDGKGRILYWSIFGRKRIRAVENSGRK